MKNFVMFNGEFFNNPLVGFKNTPKNNYAENTNANNKIVLTKIGRNSYDISNLKWGFLNQSEVDYLVSLLDIVPTTLKIFQNELKPIEFGVWVKSVTLSPKFWTGEEYIYEDVSITLEDLRW